jgi:hypothetical protein
MKKMGMSQKNGEATAGRETSIFYQKVKLRLKNFIITTLTKNWSETG